MSEKPLCSICATSHSQCLGAEGGKIFPRCIQHWRIDSNTSSWSRDPQEPTGKPPGGTSPSVSLSQLVSHSSTAMVIRTNHRGQGYQNLLVRNLGKGCQCMKSSSTEKRTLFSSCWGLLGSEEDMQLKLCSALCLCTGQIQSSLSSCRYFKLSGIWLGLSGVSYLDFCGDATPN